MPASGSKPETDRSFHRPSLAAVGPASDLAGAILTIDLDAIVANWRLLGSRVGSAECAAVVKADAYGLGADRVAPALARAGCHTFFVAHVAEGMALRQNLAEAAIHVLNGPPPGSEPIFTEHRLIPVLNGLDQIDAWARFARRRGSALAADVHVDSGMSRLGLPAAELDVLAESPDRLDGVALDCVISHLACADEPDHELNARQLAAFVRARTLLASGRASFANSSGIFLGPAYHFDQVRPGAALYGVAPRPGHPNPMSQVVRLQAKILQVRDVDTPQTVGYGATHRCDRPARIATVAAGYADGYPRSLSNVGSGFLGQVRVPIVGRVSMDLITLDVSALSPDQARTGAMVDLIGPGIPVDAVAEAAGTIGYEILTSLGRRYHRAYLGGS